MPTMDEMNEWREKWKKEREKLQKEIDEINRKEWEKKGIKPIETGKIPVERCDHPNTIEDSTATVLWVAIMIIGSIFKGNWIIWIIATIIWFKFITRYKE